MCGRFPGGGVRPGQNAGRARTWGVRARRGCTCGAGRGAMGPARTGAVGQLAALPPKTGLPSVETPTALVDSERDPVAVIFVPLEGR